MKRFLDNLFNLSTTKQIWQNYPETQTTDTVLMVTPSTFQFNQETSATNHFQHNSPLLRLKRQVLQEFNNMVEILRQHAIRVIVLANKKNVITPDAVFPNNWFSTHVSKAQGTRVILYPMLTANRRLERQFANLHYHLHKNNIVISEVIDLTEYEKQDYALEGTGSMVLDRQNKIAYASLSPRTQLNIVQHFAQIIGYQPIIFHSSINGMPIYHTNVMLSIGHKFAVVADANIIDIHERKLLLNNLQHYGKEILTITTEQMCKMSANILELKSTSGQAKIILSENAYHAFTADQRQQLQLYAELVPIPLHTIETIGGGSARCMLSEIFY